MPPRLVGVLVSEGVALDAITNRVTAFNMFETVRAPGYPAIIPRLYVTSIYENDPPAEHAFFERARVLNAVAVEVAAPESPTHVKIAPAVDVHNSIYVLNVKLGAAGRYAVVIEQSDTEQGPWTEVGRRLLVAQGVG